MQFLQGTWESTGVASCGGEKVVAPVDWTQRTVPASHCSLEEERAAFTLNSLHNSGYGLSPSLSPLN